MADKSFGVKELNLISASGTPTITSPNSVNINATNVAISTDITVGGMVSLGAGTSISSPGSNVLTFGTNSTEKVRVTSDGNVGINDTAPSQKLNVGGNIMLEGSDQYLYLTNVGTGNAGMYVRGRTSTSELRSHSTGMFTWEVTGSEKMRLNSSGTLKVGSNTLVTPDANADNLVIDTGDVDSGLSILSATTGRIYFGDAADDEAGSIRYVHSDNSMRFETNSGERLRITSVGDVLLSGLTSKNDGRNAKGITLKSTSGISFQNFGSNGSRNWRIRPDDLSSWGSLDFCVSPTDNSNTDWPDASTDVVLELKKNKDVKIHDGNLVIGTSGHGIDFSVTTDGPNVSSELLDDYEEGTFEPIFRGASGTFNTVSYHGDTGGRYTKVGNLVMVTGCVRISGGTLDKSNISSTDTLCIGNLPFNNNPRTNGDNADNHGTLRCPVWSGSNCPNFIQARSNVNYCNLYFIGSIGSIHSTSQVSQLTNQSMVQFTLVYTSG